MKPRRLKQIQDEVAIKCTYQSWFDLINRVDCLGYWIDHTSKLYAKEMVKYHLGKAADNALVAHRFDGAHGCEYEVIPESIINTKIELL